MKRAMRWALYFIFTQISCRTLGTLGEVQRDVDHADHRELERGRRFIFALFCFLALGMRSVGADALDRVCVWKLRVEVFGLDLFSDGALGFRVESIPELSGVG